MKAYPPLPIRDDWTPGYLVARGDLNRDFAFRFQDSNGAHSTDGGRYHSAVDWFAPPLAQVAACAPGRVIRTVHSTDRKGQVYGGIVEVEGLDGCVWVMRHVLPACKVGDQVRAGDPVAQVAPWDDGAEHVHLEIWRTKAGGYRHENMIDPKTVEWDPRLIFKEEPVPTLYFEELPAAIGGTGPDIVGQRKGYSKATIGRSVAVLLRARGWIVSTLRGEDGRTYVLRWAPGTHGARFRFGPWLQEEHREGVLLERQVNTGRVMRPFRGRHRSHYPWPAAS